MSEEKKQLTVRGIITGLFGLVLITASSMYVSLKMGALPWPTVFVTILSMTVLGAMGNASLQEINVTHTLMSAGAMVAGGLAFTIPGIWILNPDAEISTLSLLTMTNCGAILGTLFSALFRKNLIEDQKLVYPIGKASYETLTTGIKNGKESLKLFIPLAFSVAFTIIRDGYGLVPAVMAIFKGSALVQPINIWISPMAMSIGALVGHLPAILWLGGAIIGYLLLVPIGISTGLFADMTAATLFRENLGIGIMLGTGIGVFIRAIIKDLRKGKTEKSVFSFSGFSKKGMLLCAVVMVLCAVAMAVLTEMSFWVAILAVCGVCVATLLSGMLTGQTGINPMEVFGILVMLLIGVLFAPSTAVLFLTAGLVAVACGLTGDVMNDLKSGYLLKTDPRQQILGEAIGGVVGAVISVLILLMLKKTYGGFGEEYLPAPQAKAVATMASGLGKSPAFFFGALIGVVLSVVGVPAATLGLGIYLSSQISIIVGLGAVVALILTKTKLVKDHDMNLVTSGLLGGEGIAGVLIAIWSMIVG